MHFEGTFLRTRTVAAAQFWTELKGCERQGKRPMVAFDDVPRQHGQPRAVRFPSLDECRRQFKKYVRDPKWKF